MTASATAPKSQAGLNAALILSVVGTAAWVGWEHLSPDRHAAFIALAQATWDARTDWRVLLRLHGYTLLSVMAALAAVRVVWLLWGRPLSGIGRVLRPSSTRTTGRSGARTRSSPSRREQETPRDDTTTPRARWAVETQERASGVEQAGGKEPAPRRWLLPDLVPYGPSPRWRFGVQWPFARREHRGYVTAMIGQAGVAKSFLLLAFAIAAVTGKPWCGLVPRRARNMLYVDCELDSETFWRRAFEVARGFGLKKPPKGLHYLELTGTSLASPEGWQRVDDARRQCKADAILVDSITIGAFTVTVNDPGAMNRLFGSFEAWGVPVFAIDHAGKDPTKGATGSFMKYAKIRSELTLRAVRRGLIQVTHSKTNFGAQRDPFQVQATFAGSPLTVSFTAAEEGREPTPGRPSPAGVQHRFLTTAPAGTSAERAPSAPLPSLAPLPLPVLPPPPAAPGCLLAWLQARPDPAEYVPSRAIYDAHVLPLRACKVQLLKLYEAGQVEREGSANGGYRYRLRQSEVTV